MAEHDSPAEPDEDLDCNAVTAAQARRRRRGERAWPRADPLYGGDLRGDTRGDGRIVRKRLED